MTPGPPSAYMEAACLVGSPPSPSHHHVEENSSSRPGKERVRAEAGASLLLLCVGGWVSWSSGWVSWSSGG